MIGGKSVSPGITISFIYHEEVRQRDRRVGGGGKDHQNDDGTTLKEWVTRRSKYTLTQVLFCELGEKAGREKERQNG